MNEKKFKNVRHYTDYVIFYSTDLAYNRIKDLEPYVKSSDKETKRIYWALYKRFKNFFSESIRIQGNGELFVANFSEIIDEGVDSCLEELQDFILNELLKHKVDDAEFIASTEVARICTEFAVAVVKDMDDIMKNDLGLLTELCDIFDLSETLKILDNFYSWITRKVVDRKIEIGSNGEIESFIKRLYESVMELEHFERAYNYAIKETKNNESKN